MGRLDQTGRRRRGRSVARLPARNDNLASFYRPDFNLPARAAAIAVLYVTTS